LSIRSDQTGATEDQHAAYGAAVVSDQAVAVGVTAVPTPITDDFSDLWFVYERLIGTFVTTGAGLTNKSYETVIDSKAMRN